MTETLKTTSVVSCPDCGHSVVEAMPLDVCVRLYECKNCQQLITPESGDCCIYCSHGTILCPTSQMEKSSYTIVRQRRAGRACTIN
ncbi:GDCCVxC domain-containing (seleno)protein [Candidatus Sororendozoicomonas aggregata]|uniref:GDCCVxC domain-containing (seleno)protein n=1 Tax=Candidatus Sororendozoicomonas aggregata TaxID=3073239 RepID=UPI002ED68FAC